MVPPDHPTALYRTLLACYGHRHWWPAETPFEVCVGAILTQNTNWGNVEKAIARLKDAGVLSVPAIGDLQQPALAELIRPAGYFNVKAARLQQFVQFLRLRHGGSLERLFKHSWQQARIELLQVKGIGLETADSILLYAGNQPSFVVDAYTRRIFSRLGLVPETIGYEEMRRLFMDALPPDPQLFNEYHALLVEHGKQICRPTPHCGACCLAAVCRYRPTGSRLHH